MVIKAINILLIITSFLVITSCSSNISHSEKEATFIISSASSVRIIPGEKERAIEIKLSFFVSEIRKNTQIDSVYFRNAYVPVIIEGTNDKLLIICTIKDSDKMFLTSDAVKLKNDEAFVYYTINRKSNFHKLENIVEKEAIYLP